MRSEQQIALDVRRALVNLSRKRDAVSLARAKVDDAKVRLHRAETALYDANLRLEQARSGE